MFSPSEYPFFSFDMPLFFPSLKYAWDLIVGENRDRKIKPFILCQYDQVLDQPDSHHLISCLKTEREKGANVLIWMKDRDNRDSRKEWAANCPELANRVIDRHTFWNNIEMNDFWYNISREFQYNPKHAFFINKDGIASTQANESGFNLIESDGNYKKMAKRLAHDCNYLSR